MDMQVIDDAKLRFHSISTFPVCDSPQIRPFLYLQTLIQKREGMPFR